MIDIGACYTIQQQLMRSLAGEDVAAVQRVTGCYL